MGILAGKFNAQSRFGAGDFRARWHDNPQEYAVFMDDLQNVEALKPLAQGRTLAQLALQFAMQHPAVTTVIPGAKTVRQLDDNLAAARLAPLSAGEMAAIDAIVAPGKGRKIWPA